MCDTDHNLVCLKSRIRIPYRKKLHCVPKGRRYGVTKLRSNFSSNSNGDEPLKLTFVTQVLKEAHAALA